MLTLEQKSAVYERVDHFVKMGNEKLGTDLEGPHVRFDKRGTCGGTACYSLNELNFNAGLMIDNWDEYMNQVIPHEVAHLLKAHVYGEHRKGKLHSPHGVYWQRIMVMLGVNPDRTHNMDVSKVAYAPRPKTKHVYMCPCCDKEFVISQVRHNKMLRGRADYQHCRGTSIKFVRTIGKVSQREAYEHKEAGTKPAPQQKKAAAAKKKGEPKAGTKIARALEVYRAHAGEGRQTIIGQIALTLGITDKRAGQIYQDCKRREG